MKKMGWTE